jgi:hypothetical protein
MSQRKAKEPRGGNHEALPGFVVCTSRETEHPEYSAGVKNFQEHMDFLYRYMITGVMVGATCYSMACIFGGVR